MDYRRLRNELFKRTERYANGVRRLYDQALADIAKEFANMEYDPSRVFSFDEVGKFDRVNEIMTRLEGQIQQVVEKGIVAEFGQAYNSCNELIRQVVGNRMNEEVAKAFMPRVLSGNAAKVFIKANRAGNITASQRVWNGAALGQIETAVEEGLMEGMPANRMAKLLEDYLIDPDSCFRRFRIKTGVDADGKSMYGRKWKKRIIHEDGSTTWKNADPRDYPVGSGVYHSSYKNALRYARTTTNIAYRTADYDRYQDLPFVIGIEIKTSGNHPESDICDELAGEYPKDFLWTGWHPNCRCYQVPILAKPDEVEKMTDAIMEGEDPNNVPVEGRITDVPDNFNSWVGKNMERIIDAQRLPYFLRDNGKRDAQGVWHVKEFTKYATIAEEGYSLRAGMTQVENTNYVSTETPILSSNTESMAYMQKLLNIRDAEATKYLDAIEYYVGNGYVKVRDFQQGKDLGDEVAKIVEPISNNLERLISISPKYDGTTYRGLNVNNTTLRRFIDLADNGGILSMDGTSSWSTDEMTAKYFAAGDEKRVIIRCNGKQMGTSIRAYAANPHEHEILVSRKAKWKITGYKTIHGVYYFDVILI